MIAKISGMMLVLLTVLSTVGCGSSSTSSTSGLGANGADLTQALDCGTGPALVATAATPASAALPPLRHVPARSLHVMSGGVDTSLCDLLKASGKQLALFQFVSQSCYSCTKWLDGVSAAVKASYGKNVLVVAIVVDPTSTLSDAEMQAMQSQSAPDATWVRDVDHTLWDFFSLSPTPDAPVTPLTIVMDWAARGFYCSDDTKAAADLVTLADADMQLAIAKQ